MREALRTVFEPAGGLIAEARPNWRFGNQADATGDASEPLPYSGFRGRHPPVSLVAPLVEGVAHGECGPKWTS